MCDNVFFLIYALENVALETRFTLIDAGLLLLNVNGFNIIEKMNKTNIIEGKNLTGCELCLNLRRKII